MVQRFKLNTVRIYFPQRFGLYLESENNQKGTNFINRDLT